MGTSAHVLACGGGPGIIQQAKARLEDLERRWSRFLPDSELSQLNRASGPVVVSADTYAVVATAIEAWHLTKGRFDPTVATTMEQAGYDRPYAMLDPETVREDVKHVACRTPADVILYPSCSAVQLGPNIRFDLGGLAKGVAADLVGHEMLLAGATGSCVNVGGDIRMAGISPRPEGWQVRLDCPGAEGTVAIGLNEGAVCTSTTQARRWLGPSGPEHHIREPTSGRPAATGLTTVTVVAATATQAEVLAKVALLAGEVAGANLIGQAEATGVMVTDGGMVVELAGLDPFKAAALG